MGFPFGGGKQTAQPPQQSQPQQNMYADPSINMQARETDVDFAKFVLDPKKYELVFNKMFAGWRQLREGQDLTVFGKTVNWEGTVYAIDIYERLMNEKGASYLLGSILPLISEGATTSNLNYSDIYFPWYARLVTLQNGLLGSCHITMYICKKCNMRTNNFNIIKDHEIDKHGMVDVELNDTSGNQLHSGVDYHKGFVEILNPYELDPDRIGEVNATLISFVMHTMKAKGGFAMTKLTENNATMNMNRMMPMYMPPPQQNGGLINSIRKIF